VKDSDYRNSQIKRTLIRNRTERSLENYRVWRSYDRAMQKFEGAYCPGVFKISVAPATLIKLFGYPSDATDQGLYSTGEYNFEDSNLDCFCIFDLK